MACAPAHLSRLIAAMRRISAEPMSPLAPLSRWLGLGAAVTGIVAVAGVRLGGVPPLNGVIAYSAALLLACLAAVAAVGACVTIWRHGGPGLRLAVRGVLLALLVVGPAAWFGALAVRLPMLNDVSTDVTEPPSFGRSRAAVDGRQGLIPSEFNAGTGEDQQAAYPDVQPIIMDQTPDEALLLALRAATNLGWRVLDSTPPAGRTGIGRIEATARTLVFGFTDDVTIRIRPVVNETRIDVRSRSRIGRHDFGANARRILAFQREIEALALAAQR
jgi:uncharacterized protein (DUF1499 family)